MLANAFANDGVQTGYELRSFRGHFQISLKSTAAQRWAAKIAKDGNYYVVTGPIWRGAFKSDAAYPEGSQFLPGQRNVLFFAKESDAEKAASLLFVHLRNHRGVKV